VNAGLLTPKKGIELMENRTIWPSSAVLVETFSEPASAFADADSECGMARSTRFSNLIAYGFPYHQRI